MLSFPSNLSNALIGRNNQAYWYIKLYYGDESSFTGLSDRDRTIDSVKYRGLVKSWGTLVQSVDLFALRAGTLAMNGLTLVNVHDTIEGGRFTDLFASQNYINRKWTLHMGAVGVAVADHVQIGQGIITDQIEQGADHVTLQLLEGLKDLAVEVPTRRITDDNYTNIPEKNIEKPIPMAYGDFGLKTGIGTVPTSGAEFDRYFVKGYFPSPITNGWDSTNARVNTSPDRVTLNELREKNVFMHKDGKYLPCEDSNVNVAAASPRVSFSSSSWRAYFPCQAWNTYNTGDYENSIDNDFSTSVTFATNGATHEMTTGWRVPKVPKLGEFTSLKFIFDFGAFGGTQPVELNNKHPFQVTFGANDYEVTWNGGDQSITASSHYSQAKQDAWDFEDAFLLEIDDGGAQNDDQTVVLNQVGIEIEFSPSQTFLKESLVPGYDFTVYTDPINQATFRVAPYMDVTPIADVGEYIYYSGKGREFGAWVDADSRANGYDSGDLIENPVYQIEDILRTELSLTSSDIDYSSFDTAGNTTNGTLANVFNDTIGDIKYAFCQYKFIDGWELCQELARSAGLIVFYSGDGKVKIVVRQRDEDYTSSDKSIDYSEISNIKPGLTPLGNVRNKTSIRYNMDYATDSLQTTTPVSEDATSQGAGEKGYTVTREIIQDNRFILNSTTAENYSDALLDWLAYQKKTLNFNVTTPAHNDLEIGDTISFTNWDSNFKIYGNSIGSTDIYMITQISKTPHGCTITAQEVSEVDD